MTRATPIFSRPRRGTAYVLMLGMSLMVTVIGLSALYATRAAGRSSALAQDADDARLLALSALELAQQWIAQDPNWRTNRPSGAWATDQPIGNAATYTIDVIDPADNNLADDPHQSVVVSATVKKGLARCKMQVTLVAQPQPLAALKYAIHTAGLLRIRTLDQLYAGNATLSTNSTFENNGVLHGNAVCLMASPAGVINGTLTTGAEPRPVPAPDVPDRYAAIGTRIDPSNDELDRRVLGPGTNPFGEANPLGIYVIRASGDVRIRRSRIFGTLVIFLPSGSKATFEDCINIQPARPDLPAVIVRGDADFSFTSAGTPLSEPAQDVNFNRPGAPYQGTEDGDRADSYPSQIKGLIHVTGTVDLRNDGVINGAILSESPSSWSAVSTGTREIFYDPELYRNPPRHYTTAVPMVALRGSYRRMVD
jgi:Tfp pilus assembly protein PilX